MFVMNQHKKNTAVVGQTLSSLYYLLPTTLHGGERRAVRDPAAPALASRGRPRAIGITLAIRGRRPLGARTGASNTLLLLLGDSALLLRLKLLLCLALLRLARPLLLGPLGSGAALVLALDRHSVG